MRPGKFGSPASLRDVVVCSFLRRCDEGAQRTTDKLELVDSRHREGPATADAGDKEESDAIVAG